MISVTLIMSLDALHRPHTWQFSIFNIQTFQFLVFSFQTFQYSKFQTPSKHFTTRFQISNFSFQLSVFIHPNSNISVFKIFKFQMLHIEISNFKFQFSTLNIHTSQLRHFSSQNFIFQTFHIQISNFSFNFQYSHIIIQTFQFLNLRFQTFHMLQYFGRFGTCLPNN